MTIFLVCFRDEQAPLLGIRPKTPVISAEHNKTISTQLSESILGDVSGRVGCRGGSGGQKSRIHRKCTKRGCVDEDEMLSFTIKDNANVSLFLVGRLEFMFLLLLDLH